MEDQATPEPQMRSTSTYSAAGNGRRKKIIFSIVIIALLLLSVGLAWFFMNSRQEDEDLVAIPTVTEEPTPFPTPEIVEIYRQDTSIRVLNASGIAGEATLLKEELEGLGYSEIEVGNASVQNATTTTVAFSTDLSEEVVDEITTKLNELYQSVTVSTSATGNFDVDIQLGLRQGQARSTSTPTPQATLTPTQAAAVEATTTPSPTPAQ